MINKAKQKAKQTNKQTSVNWWILHWSIKSCTWNNSHVGSPSMVMVTILKRSPTCSARRRGRAASTKWAGKGEASHTPRTTLRRWQTSTVHATALCAQLRHATACYGALSALAPGGRCNACYCACYGTLSALARVAHHHEKHHHLRFYVISGIVLIPY